MADREPFARGFQVELSSRLMLATAAGKSLLAGFDGSNRSLMCDVRDTVLAITYDRQEPVLDASQG